MKIGLDLGYVNPKDILKYIKKLVNKGITSCQIFVTKHGYKHVDKMDGHTLDKIKRYVKKYNFKLIIHSSYMQNFARIPIIDDTKKQDVKGWWIDNLLEELECGQKMGAYCCVIHLGKHMELSKKMAMENMYTSISYVVKNMPKNIKLALETSSGQGTEMCYKLEDLRVLYGMINDYRVGICVDTCHLFAAGYDLRGNKNVKKFFKLFDKLIGTDIIILCHLNDSVKKLGSHVDRHAKIGQGMIGKEGLVLFYKICNKLDVPIIREN